MTRLLSTLPLVVVLAVAPVSVKAADIADLVRDHYADSSGVRTHPREDRCRAGRRCAIRQACMSDRVLAVGAALR